MGMLVSSAKSLKPVGQGQKLLKAQSVVSACGMSRRLIGATTSTSNTFRVWGLGFRYDYYLLILLLLVTIPCIMDMGSYSGRY